MVHTLYTAVLVLFAGAVLPLSSADAWPFDPPVALPATATIKHMLSVTLRSPVLLPPVVTQPGLYYNRTLWQYRGIPCTLIVASYSNSAVGPYNELVYFPGKYNPCANAPDLFYESVMRSWVDTKQAMEAGRYLSGMPTYLANFKWQLDPVTRLPVNVTVRANKKLILAIIGLKPCTSNIAGATEIPSHTTAQWPIYPTGTRRPANDRPLIINTTVNLGAGPIGNLNMQADKGFVDALAFTGNAASRGIWLNHAVCWANAVLSAPEGSTVTVSQHGELQCP